MSSSEPEAAPPTPTPGSISRCTKESLCAYGINPDSLGRRCRRMPNATMLRSTWWMCVSSRSGVSAGPCAPSPPAGSARHRAGGLPRAPSAATCRAGQKRAVPFLSSDRLKHAAYSSTLATTCLVMSSRLVLHWCPNPDIFLKNTPPCLNRIPVMAHGLCFLWIIGAVVTTTEQQARDHAISVHPPRSLACGRIILQRSTVTLAGRLVYDTPAQQHLGRLLAGAVARQVDVPARRPFLAPCRVEWSSGTRGGPIGL